uniref:ATP synthase F0 subunit 8 n=1 Tax=Madagascaria erythrocladioides TaxID=753684 RepID=UPI001FCCF636|nr:ATP synthase F0 subunit 8 [Madagascaria erythrocladioides]UNJ18795.1 ATP synthase F0 subunit 8 [Madagascaria erythrocladioides]
MPQLNSNVIFSQLFWLILIFYFLYAFTLHVILPNIVKILKLRNTIPSFYQTNKQKIYDLNNTHQKNSFLNLVTCLETCNKKQHHIMKLFKQAFISQKISDKAILNKAYVLIIYNNINLSKKKYYTFFY